MKKSMLKNSLSVFCVLSVIVSYSAFNGCSGYSSSSEVLTDTTGPGGTDFVFGHNEHEIVRAREMAHSLGMTFQPKLNAYSVFSPIKDAAAVKRDSGLEVASRKEFKEKKKRYWGMPCDQLWNSPQINRDGKLLGCCVNGWGDFGNVFESGLKAAMESGLPMSS